VRIKLIVGLLSIIMIAIVYVGLVSSDPTWDGFKCGMGIYTHCTPVKTRLDNKFAVQTHCILQQQKTHLKV